MPEISAPAFTLADFLQAHADEPVVKIGDPFRLAIQLPDTPEDVDRGIRSPLLRVRDIRRDAAGVVEILADQVPDEPPA
jgi:hypothetical protein